MTQINGLRIAKTFLSKIFADGKVYVPARVREALNIKDSDILGLSIIDGEIILRKLNL